jgi:hypothetical protein
MAADAQLCVCVFVYQGTVGAINQLPWQLCMHIIPLDDTLPLYFKIQ